MIDPLVLLSLFFAFAAFLFALYRYIDQFFTTRQSIFEKYSEKIKKIQIEFQLHTTKEILQFVKKFNIPDQNITDEWVQQEYPKLESELNKINNVVQSTAIPRIRLQLYQESKENIQKRILKWIFYVIGWGVLLFLLDWSITIAPPGSSHYTTLAELVIGIIAYYVLFGIFFARVSLKEFKRAREAQQELDALIEAYEFNKDEMLERISQYSEDKSD